MGKLSDERLILMMYSFENKLKKIIVNCNSNANIDIINMETDLVADFGFESVDLVQLVIDMETSFNVEFEDEYLVIERLSPYKELVEIIRTKLCE